MDYKEKYEMALEGIQEILGSGEDSIKMSRLQLRLQGIFPELKESEDEKIRKTLIHIVKGACDKYGIKYQGKEINEEKLIDWLEKQGEKKLVWSNDFEEEMDRYIEDNFYGSADNGFFSNRTKRELEVEDVIRIGCHFAAWQKEQSNKELSDKPKQEWSEEDEYCIHQLIVFCENCMVQDDGAKRCAHWLKSLRPQSQWKPSDEQIEALDFAIDCIVWEEFCVKRKVLKELLEQLKKL